MNTPYDIINSLVREIERNICLHEEVERRGLIWSKCTMCGGMFADDEGGVPEPKEPKCLIIARKYLDDNQPENGLIEIPQFEGFEYVGFSYIEKDDFFVWDIFGNPPVPEQWLNSSWPKDKYHIYKKIEPTPKLVVEPITDTERVNFSLGGDADAWRSVVDLDILIKRLNGKKEGKE